MKHLGISKLIKECIIGCFYSEDFCPILEIRAENEIRYARAGFRILVLPIACWRKFNAIYGLPTGICIPLCKRDIPLNGMIITNSYSWYY